MEQIFNQIHQLKSSLEMKGKVKLHLTKREKEVLEYICIGKTNNEIALKLLLSPKTIEGYKTRLLSKTKTRNMAHLVMFAAVNGIIKGDF